MSKQFLINFEFQNKKQESRILRINKKSANQES